MEANVKLAIEILKEAGYDTANLKLRATPFIDDEEKMRDYFKLTESEFMESYSYLTSEEYEATKEAVNKIIEDTRIEYNEIPISEHALDEFSHDFYWHEIADRSQFTIVCLYYGIAYCDIEGEWRADNRFYCFERSCYDHSDVYVYCFDTCFEETNNFFRHFGYELTKI